MNDLSFPLGIPDIMQRDSYRINILREQLKSQREEAFKERTELKKTINLLEKDKKHLRTQLQELRQKIFDAALKKGNILKEEYKRTGSNQNLQTNLNLVITHVEWTGQNKHEFSCDLTDYGDPVPNTFNTNDCDIVAAFIATCNQTEKRLRELGYKIIKFETFNECMIRHNVKGFV